MSEFDKIKLWCWVLGDTSNRVFGVSIKRSATIRDLKRAIQGRKPPFKDIAADSLKLFKFQLPLENFNEDCAQSIKLEDSQRLESWKRISFYWMEDPGEEEVLSVILPRPANTTSLLAELHRKLWGRRDLFGETFRTANLTKADFIELQCQLQEHNPDRNSESYVAKNVLATKSAFLRSRSTHFDPGFGDGLVPRLVFDASQGLTQPPSSDVMDDDDNADGVADDTMVIDPDPGSSGCSYIYSDAHSLSTGTTAIFPCTIQYMDLTVLKLENELRVPQLMLLRQEWGKMVDIFNGRAKGIRGSGFFTGQPGIGKTCLLYSILIQCIIHAKPIVFQDMNGSVFIINETVQQQQKDMPLPKIPGDEVLTLVDADGTSCQPDPYLFDASNLRILLTSSPRKRKDLRWLTQSVRETGAVFVMELWSRKEFLVASLFLASIDITLKRFQETSDICGLIPRPCLDAAVSLETLHDAKGAIIDAIEDTKELSQTLFDVHSGVVIHRAFQIRPSPESRRWSSILTEPVSDWAFSKMMTYLDERSTETAYEFYRAIKWTTFSSVLCRKMFETKLHTFFRTITSPRTFTIHSLDDRSTTFDIKFSSNTEHVTFGTIKDFADQLASNVESNKSCYLKPLSHVIPTFDSFLYQDGISQSGHSPLIGLQVTTASEDPFRIKGLEEHPISIKGLEKVQKSLNSRMADLEPLKPSQDKKLIILFVVPDTKRTSFVKQQIKDAERVSHWYEKTSQYVLILPVKEVFPIKVILITRIK